MASSGSGHACSALPCYGFLTGLTSGLEWMPQLPVSLRAPESGALKEGAGTILRCGGRPHRSRMRRVKSRTDSDGKCSAIHLPWLSLWLVGVLFFFKTMQFWNITNSKICTGKTLRKWAQYERQDCVGSPKSHIDPVITGMMQLQEKISLQSLKS